MSVEVKTPTKTQFEHVEFQCGERTPPGSSHPGPDSLHAASFAAPNRGPRHQDRSRFQRQDSNSQASQNQKSGFIARKRRSSERAPERSGSFSGIHPLKKKFKYGKTQEKIVLPSKFLLGGNINDPLNLNSLCDEAVNEALNRMTPHSSPLPLPVPAFRQQVQVLIPPNISDPLNLNSSEDVGLNLKSPKAKKKRQKKKRRSTGDNDASTSSEVNDVTRPLHIDVQPIADTSPAPIVNMEQKLRHIVDKIVSPVIPQASPKGQKRKRTTSDCDSTKSDSSSVKGDKDSAIGAKNILPGAKGRFSRQGSNQKTEVSCSQPKKKKVPTATLR